MSAMTASRQRIKQGQKTWKYIHDANSQSVADLSKIAIEDGKTTYTYGLMFRTWEQYASVFSALKMTGENKARVGVLGSTSAEVIFAYYGLNMVGAEVSLVPAYSALTPSKVIETIKNEHFTDFIVTDDFAQINLINDLFTKKASLGLRNIIIMHIPIAGVTADPAFSAMQETKYGFLKGAFGHVCMDNLLKKYGNEPVAYAPETSQDISVILHTSGSTTGTGKPVALSDRALNAAASAFYKLDDIQLPWDNLVTAVIVDLSNAYAFVDQMHVPFALGATVVTTPAGVLNPNFYKAIPEHKISFLFSISAMFERWTKMPNQGDFDFSSLTTVVLGGTSVSAADKRRFSKFVKEHGAGDITLLNGYGISELGGACCLSTPDLDDESIGYPVPGVTVRLFNEDEQRFMAPNELPQEGIMYLNAPSIATLELDGEQYIVTETIGRKPFICTNDLVRIDEDGKLTFLGRANRYFLNEEGKRYESGRVETEVARQQGIETCCVAPVYVKTTHDNIPMLCVQTLEEIEDDIRTVCDALKQVFITEKALDIQNVPVRVLLAKELPKNGNGKVDLYKIGRGEVEGTVYTVEPVQIFGELTDYRLVPYEEGPADMIQEVFDGISAEMKSNLPGHKMKEETPVGGMNDMFKNFGDVNAMGKQMMEMMEQMNPAKCDGKNAFPMPFFPPVPESMMPDKKQMKQVNKVMEAMFPTPQAMLQKSLPVVRKQVDQTIDIMSKMNKAHIDMMQKTFDQNVAMVNQFMDGLNKFAYAGTEAKKDEKDAEDVENAE